MRLKERFGKEERTRRHSRVEYHSSPSSRDNIIVVVHAPENEVEKVIQPDELSYPNSEIAETSPKRRKWAWRTAATGAVVGGIVAMRNIRIC